MSKSNEFDQHYQNWKSSGLSKASYCKQKNLLYTWFIYHCKRIETCGDGFSQIKIITKSASIIGASVIEYHFTDGSYFVFPVNCSANLIRLLID